MVIDTKGPAFPDLLDTLKVSNDFYHQISQKFSAVWQETWPNLEKGGSQLLENCLFKKYI